MTATEIMQLKNALDGLKHSLERLSGNFYVQDPVAAESRKNKAGRSPCKGPFIGPHISCNCNKQRNRIEYENW